MTPNCPSSCSVMLRDAASSDAGVLQSATAGWSFEMVAQKAGSVLCGTWVGKGAAGAWGSKLGEGQRRLWIVGQGHTCEAAMQLDPVCRLLAPANMLLRRNGCRFRKVTRREPGPAPSTAQGTLCIHGYIEEMLARLLNILGCICTVVLHTRFILLASLECLSSPSSTTRLRWMHRSADARQSIHPCWPEASGLGNQSAARSMLSGRLRFPNASFVHGAPRRSAENRYQGTTSFLGCTASLLSATVQSRVAQVGVRQTPRSCCSRRHCAIRDRELLLADHSCQVLYKSCVPSTKV